MKKGSGFEFLAIIAIALFSTELFLAETEGWSINGSRGHHSTSSFLGCTTDRYNRREFASIISSLVITGPLLSEPLQAVAADGTSDPKEKFIAARKELRDLIENYSEITAKGGGDAVRNRLGTQGINSSLFGIQKILKSLTSECDDIVEYTETMEEFNAYYYQAEGAAYQSMFVEHSSAKGTPESFLKTAKNDILQMEKYMDQLATQLKL